MKNINFSFVIPTRKRLESLRCLFDSIRDHTADLTELEVVLVVDDDDQESLNFRYPDIRIERVKVKPGLTMGGLNMAGYRRSTGKYILLLNDDIVLRTRYWDVQVLDVFRTFPDGIVLVHMNDVIFGDALCTFPFLTRKFCELAGGICNEGYKRYRIDDHIHNVFDLLSVLGTNRRVFLPGVIFQHFNVAETEQGKPEYVPDAAIHAIDTKLFESLLPERKRLAMELMSVIDRQAGREKEYVWNCKLADVTDSVAIRRPEHTRRHPAIQTGTAEKARVTVAIVSADLNNPHARKCIDLVKKHTSNFELLVVDNNRGPNFNHAHEMNRILQWCRTDYLVLLDDDVFVEPNWLEGMLRCVGENVGVVTPIHKDRFGRMSYAGVVMQPDESGYHTHVMKIGNKPQNIQTLCSAIMLIDLSRCGHVRLDETYTKYFLDIDYGLRIWEEGFRVVCSPYACATHIGGATLEQGSDSSAQLFEPQRHRYIRSWVDTGRVRKLREGIWRGVPEIVEIECHTEQIDRLFQSSATMDTALRMVRKTFAGLDAYPALKNYAVICAKKRVGSAAPDFDDPGMAIPAVIMGMAGRSTVPEGIPVLFERNLDEMNVVLWDNRLFALPADEGKFECERVRRGEHTRSFEANDPETIRQLVRLHPRGERCGHISSDGIAPLRPIPAGEAADIPDAAARAMAGFARRRAGSNGDLLATANPLAHYFKRGGFERRKPNPLFDPAYYLQTYPEVAASGINPLEHYIEYGAAKGYWPNPLFDGAYYALHYRSTDAGWNPLAHFLGDGAAQGCNPNPLFDTRWYMEQYPDVAIAGVNPLAHFLEPGAEMGYKPNPLFDTGYYLNRYGDAADMGMNPLAHFMSLGAARGYQSCPLFDTAYYLRMHPDVAASGVNPLAHFLEIGGREGYKPHPLFDSSEYLRMNPDVAGGGMNPLVHYLRYGEAEGRKANPHFDAAFYLRTNPDVAAAGMSPLVHYVQYGARERRNPNPLFDISCYLSRNPDVAASGAEPLEHFLTKGVMEGRNPSAMVDFVRYMHATS